MQDRKAPSVKTLVAKNVANYIAFNQSLNDSKIEKRNRTIKKLPKRLQIGLSMMFVPFVTIVAAIAESLVKVSPDMVGVFPVLACIAGVFAVLLFAVETNGNFLMKTLEASVDKTVPELEQKFSNKTSSFYNVEAFVNDANGDIIVSLTKAERARWSSYSDAFAEPSRLDVKSWKFSESEELQATEFITELGLVVSEANRELHNQAVDINTQRKSLAQRIDHAVTISK